MIYNSVPTGLLEEAEQIRDMGFFGAADEFHIRRAGKDERIVKCICGGLSGRGKQREKERRVSNIRCYERTFLNVEWSR